MNVRTGTAAFLLSMFCCAESGFTQGTITPPVVKARVFGVSTNMVHDSIPGIDRPSNGLPNVAKRSKVYLYCGGVPSQSSDSGESATRFVEAVYTFRDKPAGSTATIDRIDALRISFEPDVDGTFRITMTAKDDKNREATDEIAVNVAEYVGVGGITKASQKPQCSACHNQITTEWKSTNHATAFQRRIDDANGQFVPYCINCHTTGATDATAEGKGFLHLARTSVWSLPNELKPGNFDSLKRIDPELAERSNVQCENCHGPGSDHEGNIYDNRIAVSRTNEQCNQCHDAPPFHRKFADYENSAHRNSVGRGILAEYMNRTDISQTNINEDCARCHTSNGYIDVFIEGGDPSKAFSNAPYEDVGYIGCVTCHDPHSKTNVHQLRKSPDTICADCHSLRVGGHSGLHSSHQGQMLMGTGGKEFPGYIYRNSSHSNIPDRCVQCHMADPGVDSLRDLIGGHSLRVVYDNGTPADMTDDIINGEGCVQCHTTGVELSEVENAQKMIRDLLDELASYLKQRPDGKPVFPQDDTLGTMEKDLHWNWYFVNNDQSFGVHNYKYSVDLLRASIAEAGKLVSSDYPPSPRAVQLAPNFPNPFSLSTGISFSLADEQHVRIAVFDAAGHEVYLLVNSYLHPGSYRVFWNGTIAPDALPATPGIYFYRMTSGEFSQTRKMMLIR